jgi:extracellular elastinolytic metalloproteinase
MNHPPRIRHRVTVLILTVALAITTVLALSAPAPGDPAPAAVHRTGRAASVDVRSHDAELGVPRRVAQARLALARSLGSLGVVQPDRDTGTLRFVGRLDGYLTRASTRPARTVAMDFVRANRLAFGLSLADLRTLSFRGDYVDISGTHHLSWLQRSHGIPVFQNGLKASVTAQGRLVNVTGSPLHGVRVNATRPRLSATAAVAAARAAASSRLRPRSDDRATLVLFPTPRGARLAWRVIAWIASDDLTMSVVDARTGALMYRHSLTDDVQGTGSAVDMYPSGDVANDGGSLMPRTFPVFNGKKLSGNTAHVYLDTKDDNFAQPKDEIAAVSGTDWSYLPDFDTTTAAQNCSDHFYCTWDKTIPQDWKRNRKWSAVQLFYFLTKFHNHLLANPIGFDEAAGNFEATNSSGMGLGGDPVQGEALDGANTANGLPDGGHVNNANMSTPPDGFAPTMQMYLQRKTPYWPGIPTGDSGNEAETVYHEYTHGLSNRLVTYPDGTTGLVTFQSGAMGEAWSDWYAIDFTDQNGWFYDTPANGDAIVFRYSAGDDLAFRTAAVDCPVGVAATNCPGPGIGTGDGGYTYGDMGDIIGFPEVHADGEIWVQTLWQARSSIGQNVMRSLVTRGMELSPPAPSFLDMRNAILQADQVEYAGAHEGALWAIFAERGMGYFAAAASGDDVNPVEDFSLPPDCSTDPCGTISGRIRDKVTGDPVGGVTVAIAGLANGLGTDLSDTTAPDGRYTIEDVPFHSYAKVVVDAPGYEPVEVTNFTVDGDEILKRKVIRDWAALEGGAKLQKFSPPDYSDYGCGPTAAFDLLLGSGWGSDAPHSTAGSSFTGPRSIIVKLPKPVDVKSFGFDAGATCGDPPNAAVKAFTIQTRKAHGHWVTAFKTSKALPQGRLIKIRPRAGAKDVRFVRLIMRSNRGNALYMDMSELSVRGT